MYRWGTGWSSCTPTPSPDFSVMKTTWMTAVPSSQGNSTVHRLVTEPHQVKWAINIWTLIWYRSFRYITVFGVFFHNLKISNNCTLLIKVFPIIYSAQINVYIRYTVWIQFVHVIYELCHNKSNLDLKFYQLGFQTLYWSNLKSKSHFIKVYTLNAQQSPIVHVICKLWRKCHA